MRKGMIFTLVLALLLLAGCGPKTVTTETGESIEIVAKVGEAVVTLDAFNKNYLIVENTYKELYGQDIMAQAVGSRTLRELVREQILSNMVLELVVKQSLQAVGTSIKSEQVDENYTKYFEQELKDNPTRNDFYEANGIDEVFIKAQLENQLYIKEIKNQISEEINKAVSGNEEGFKLNPARIKARHILVADRVMAEEILKKLQAGEDFTELAKVHNIDPGSKETGGELDYFGRGDMVKEFEDAAFALKTGGMSGIVETQFGFHIIQVEGVKTIKDLEAEGINPEELKVIKDNVLESMIETAYLARIEQYKTKIKIETYPEMIQEPK